MLSASPPAENELWIYDTASACQKDPAPARLQQLRSAIQAHYADYDSAGDLCWALPQVSWPTTDSERLQANYDHLSRAALGGLRTRLLSRSSKCMRCGTSEAGTLDHHLPKNTFPEFSVLTLNLIPCCGRCNQRKSNNHLDGNGEPRFLHPYYDELPVDEPYLVVHLRYHPAGVEVAYQVTRPATMTTGVFKRLERQFTDLRLGEVYSQAAGEVLQELRDQLYALHRAGGQAEVSRSLHLWASSAQHVFGSVNHWKVRLLRTLAVDAGFCSHDFRRLGAERPLLR